MGGKIGMKDFFLVEDKDYDILYHAKTHKMFKIDKVNKDDYTDDDFYKMLEKYIPDRENKLQIVNLNRKISLNLMCSRTCNLGCKYCFAGEGEYGCNSDKPKYISKELYKDLEDFLLEKFPDGVNSISFFGGEPLLNYDNISEFVTSLEEKYNGEHIELPKFSINTNAVLLNDKVIDFVKKHDIEIGLSLDGPKHLNDIGRTSKNESKISTYDIVEKAIKKLKDNEINYKIQWTINENHIKEYKEGIVEKWLESLGENADTEIAMCPVTTDVDGLSINSEDDYKVLDRMAREFVNYYYRLYEKGTIKKSASVYITPMLYIINKQMARACTAGEKSILIDTDGTIYPCHMYCNDSKSKLGNIYNGFENIKINQNTENRITNDTCQNCIGRTLCTAWCKGLQFLTNGSEDIVLKERCVFQKAIIEENLKILSKMQQKDKYKLKQTFENIYKSIGD